MDLFVKNNLIKKDKLIIDVGRYCTKCMMVRYAAKRITVTKTRKLLSSAFCIDNDTIDFKELAKHIERITEKKMDISISLPASMVDYRIISIKNKRKSDLKRIIEREHAVFGRVTPLTHEIDFSHERYGEPFKAVLQRL